MTPNSVADVFVSSDATREKSSFRDPAGYLFWRGGKIYRCVRPSYQPTLELATKSGLLTELVERGLLLPYTIVDAMESSNCSTVICPEQLPFISYPYEWCFEQLRDAAIATLDLHLAALDRGLILKDASAYNIQFVEGRPVLIDHLSFEAAAGHAAWPAYGQFCRHFLAPLALLSYADIRLSRLSELYIDGVPLDLASALLPRRTRFLPGLVMHLHLHARMSVGFSNTQQKVRSQSKSLTVDQLKAIAVSLKGTITKLRPPAQATEWGNYYEDTNYSRLAAQEKSRLIRSLAERTGARVIWDVGGNDGTLSRSLSDMASQIVTLDIDPAAVAANYAICKKEKIRNVLPLIFDCCNPTPAIGFANQERPSLLQRGKPDLVLALALIHHLAISNNLPLLDIVSFFADLSPSLIIEFVDKSDSQVQRLLLNRPDIFDGYTLDGFRNAAGHYFDIVEEKPIIGTARTLFLLRRKRDAQDIQSTSRY